MVPSAASSPFTPFADAPHGRRGNIVGAPATSGLSVHQRDSQLEVAPLDAPGSSPDYRLAIPS
jgi:hypothetical protein